MRWSTSEAQQQLDDVLRAAESEPQIVTHDGADVAAVISVAEYRRLVGDRRRGPTGGPVVDPFEG